MFQTNNGPRLPPLDKKQSVAKPQRLSKVYDMHTYGHGWVCMYRKYDGLDN